MHKATDRRENPEGSWEYAVTLLERWQTKDERVDVLLDSLPAELAPAQRARVQALLLGAVRHLGRIDRHLNRLIARPPREWVWAALVVAGFELLEVPDSAKKEGYAARVCHHAVEKIKCLASPPESRLANAVLRKLAAAMATETAPGEGEPVNAWASYYSHPEWLIERWIHQFGAGEAHRFVEWNQRIAPIIVRWRNPAVSPTKDELTWLKPIDDSRQFFSVEPGHWPDVLARLSSGVLVVQDTATRDSVELLNPQPHETVLDLCAAPGGKSLAIADRMGSGRVVSVDLPSPRLDRLLENLQRAPKGVKTSMVRADLLQNCGQRLEQQGLPRTYDAVLVDVPCSNTGVMRHRVDVKWRIQLDDFREHALQQLAMLQAAADRVAAGGRLVYSTCSVDPEENQHVVNAFVRRSRGAFKLVDSCLSLPWESGHDGAGAFLLKRT